MKPCADTTTDHTTEEPQTLGTGETKQIYLYKINNTVVCLYYTDVPDGFVMVLGGFYDGESITGTSEILDLSKADSGCGVIPENPHHGGVFEGTIGYYGGKVLYCSYNCHEYQPGYSEWKAMSDSISRQRFAGASSVIQGVWLVSGGTTSGVTTNTTEYWDGALFHPGPDMPQPMNRHCQVTISESRVFFHTPYVDASDPIGRTFFLNWNDKSWERLDSGTMYTLYGTCGMVKTSTNGWEIVVTDIGTSSIFNLQSK